MVDQSPEVNIESTAGSAAARFFEARKRDFWDKLSYWLVFAIFILIFLLLKNVVLARIDTPRTSLERDIMINAARLKLYPKDAVAHAGLGVAYMNMGGWRAAAAEFATAVGIDPKNAQYRYNLAVAYRELNRYSEALKQLEIAQKRLPHWETPYFEAGRIYLRLKKYPEAILALEHSLEKAGENADAHYYLGRAYQLEGQNDLAVFHYRQTLKYVPDYARAGAAIKRIIGK